MEFLLELVMELLVEGSMEAVSNKKLSKYIRYPLACMLLLFFAVVIFAIFLIGIAIRKENIYASLLILLAGFILLIASIIKGVRIYQEIKQKEEKMP